MKEYIEVNTKLINRNQIAYYREVALKDISSNEAQAVIFLINGQKIIVAESIEEIDSKISKEF